MSKRPRGLAPAVEPIQIEGMGKPEQGDRPLNKAQDTVIAWALILIVYLGAAALAGLTAHC